MGTRRVELGACSECLHVEPVCRPRGRLLAVAGRDQPDKQLERSGVAAAESDNRILAAQVGDGGKGPRALVSSTMLGCLDVVAHGWRCPRWWLDSWIEIP